jgi:hypothetical protein
MKTPFKMKGFSGYGSESPLKQDKPSIQDQTKTKKAKKVQVKPQDRFGAEEDYRTLKKHFPNTGISLDDDFYKGYQKTQDKAFTGTHSKTWDDEKREHVPAHLDSEGNIVKGKK